MRLLPEYPVIDRSTAGRLRQDFQRFASEGMPSDVEAYIRETYRVDLASEYGGCAIKNPFGKASGQLSLHTGQVREDAEGGLGFIVLKTVIAQDETGQMMMQDWAIKETRMHVEPIAGKRFGELGWTVTWKGRGWHESFAAYQQFMADALALATPHGVVVAPSVKYHLPGPNETHWKVAEYEYTTRQLLAIWREAGQAGPMPLEKDFSPTLAGDDRSSQQARILEWMNQVPALVRGAVPEGSVRLGMKLMNATFDDEFQKELVLAALPPRPDYLIYANRLFDPKKAFLGKVGVAYGGPDLSERNLRILTLLRRLEVEGRLPAPVPPVSGTGDVTSGQIAVEYALRGASSLQMHTLFQLPNHFFTGRKGNKSHRVLHHLLFHPLTGLLPWLLHLREQHGLVDGNGLTTFKALTQWYRQRPEILEGQVLQ